jgi:hypothetical protein
LPAWESIYNCIADCLAGIWACITSLWRGEPARRVAPAQPFLVPPAQYNVLIPGPKTYNRVVDQFSRLPAEIRARIVFDDNERMIHFHYDKVTLDALAFKYPAFRSIFGPADKRMGGVEVQEPNMQVKDVAVREGEEFLRAQMLPSKVDVSDITTDSHLELFRTIFARTDMACLCEWHMDSLPKYLLFLDMGALHTAGVRTIFVEGYPHETLQPELDAFINGPSDAPMPKTLEAFLDYLADQQAKLRQQAGDKRSFYTEKDFILAARRHRIRVVGLDTESALLAQTTPQERCAAFNHQATRIIDTNRGEGKALLMMGAAHGVDMFGMPGLGSIFGCPTFLAKDRSAASDPRGFAKNYQTTFQTPAGEVQLRFDFALHTDAPRKS